MSVFFLHYNGDTKKVVVERTPTNTSDLFAIVQGKPISRTLSRLSVLGWTHPRVHSSSRVSLCVLSHLHLSLVLS